MPSVGRFLELLEALSRRDRQAVAGVIQSVANEERERKHFTAAHQLLQALEVANLDTGYDRVGTLALAATPATAPPIDAIDRVDDPAKNAPALPQLLQREVRDFIAEWHFESRLRERGLAPRSTVLLYGPPGCGKTHLAQHLATALGMPMFVVRFDGLVSSYLGETASNLRRVFDFIRDNRCLLLIDEIDAVAKLRDDRNDLGELKRVVISLLQNLDLHRGRSPLVAATNHPHLLDPAIWRRFDVVWHIPLPNPDQRSALLRQEVGDALETPVLDALVHATEGLSGADIVRAGENAKRKVVLQDVGPAESVLISLIEVVRARTSIESDARQNLLTHLALALRSAKTAHQYSFKELELLTGIPHSTLHHHSRPGRRDFPADKQ